MADYCDDNRFELIEKYKQKLIDETNIETAPDEMAVINDILFRFWQMGWLDKLEQPEQRWIPCSERLPEDGQIVLISQTYGWTEFEEGTEVTVAQFKRGYFTWYRYQADWNKHTSQMHHGDICPGIEYVDAWMPLPSPYTQE